MKSLFKKITPILVIIGIISYVFIYMFLISFFETLFFEKKNAVLLYSNPAQVGMLVIGIFSPFSILASIGFYKEFIKSKKRKKEKAKKGLFISFSFLIFFIIVLIGLFQSHVNVTKSGFYIRTAFHFTDTYVKWNDIKKVEMTSSVRHGKSTNVMINYYIYTTNNKFNLGDYKSDNIGKKRSTLLELSKIDQKIRQESISIIKKTDKDVLPYLYQHDRSNFEKLLPLFTKISGA